MKNTLTHFALYVDEMERAQAFYEKVFDWSFHGYGPAADFRQIKAGNDKDAPLIGAIQHHKYSPLDTRVIGLEGTIQVKDLAKVEQAVRDGGGTILMPRTAIPHVGWLIKFLDTEGNLLCAMQADSSAIPEK
ncbi:MAG: VOC family protein [Owenweeksia sp.]